MRTNVAMLAWLLVTLAHSIPAVAQELTSLEIYVRDAGGLPLANENIRIALSLEANSTIPNCVTDSTGRCHWAVESGIYEVYWDRWLDALSRQASAENGLNSFGITVGNEPITYHFVLHADNHIYFDAAPDAVVPEPIIPTEDMIFTHGVDLAEAASKGVPFSAENATSTPSATPTIDDADANTTGLWRLLLFIGAGLVIGGAFFWWTQRKAGGDRHA